MVEKAYVLAEIRRTAASNGGTPLGMKRFFSETGITANDWLGKHWARWGDALLEAGFEPNRLQAPYDAAFLNESLITLCRKLGHFPTRVEMEMERRADQSFPTPRVFQRRGSKTSVAEQLAAYCADRPDLTDIVAMCTQVVPGSIVSSAERGEENFGYVYLLRSGRFYKIGRTNSVGRRERELAVQLPERATLVHSIRTDDPAGIEQYWHQRFAAQRANGEWFALESTHVAVLNADASCNESAT